MGLLILLPLITCAIVIIFLKHSALTGAFTGLIVTLALIGWSDIFSLPSTNIKAALSDAGILTISAVMVILPGLYFNAIIKSHGTISAIQHWVEQLPFSKEHKMLLLLFGLLPAIESLTGFGVSLFLSIPILLHLFSKPEALRLAMLGMNIMPWGTLALATTVGATLSGVSVYILGWHTALTSLMVFPLLSFSALYVIGGLGAVNNNWKVALGLSLGLSVSLLFFNGLQLTEIAGVLSGLFVCVVGALITPKAIPTYTASNVKQTLLLFTPYISVLSLIALERFLPGLHELLGNSLILNGHTVELKVLTSPGIALLLVSIILYCSLPKSLSHKAILTRAGTASFSLFAFIILAQIMLQSGMIEAFVSTLTNLNGELLLVFSPIIGMVSGFITGSNLSGNALTMTMQASIGASLDAKLSFAAAQNSGAGHAVFTSIPVIVLILTIAKDAGPQSGRGKLTPEHSLLKFGLYIASLIMLMLMLTTWMIGQFGSYTNRIF